MGSSILIVILSNVMLEPKALIIWDLVEPLFRETNQTNFTWEYFRKGISGQEMSASKSDALLRMIERLLDDSPNYDNFCVSTNTQRMLAS